MHEAHYMNVLFIKCLMISIALKLVSKTLGVKESIGFKGKKW